MFQCYHTYVYLDTVTKFVHNGDHFITHTVLLLLFLTLLLQTFVDVTDTCSFCQLLLLVTLLL